MNLDVLIAVLLIFGAACYLLLGGRLIAAMELAHVRERAGDLPVVPASFDPYLAPEPLGVDAVWEWIEAQGGGAPEPPQV